MIGEPRQLNMAGCTIGPLRQHDAQHLGGNYGIL